jgi:hypothetical protein
LLFCVPNLSMPKESILQYVSETTITDLDARTKRYVLCLGMVHLILERELSTSCDIRLFRQIGVVASFIDEHLDELNLDKKQDLQVSFDKLYSEVTECKTFTNFNRIVCKYVEKNKLIFDCNNLNLSELYLFIGHCKKNELSEILGNFGKQIIECSIEKQQARTTNQVRKLLKIEGLLVCNLLENLLKKKHSANPKFSTTMALLIECEQILNLADDSIDAFEDKTHNIIGVHNSSLHGVRMLGYLGKQLLKTFAYYPFQFMYYTPTLIRYYIKNK